MSDSDRYRGYLSGIKACIVALCERCAMADPAEERFGVWVHGGVRCPAVKLHMLRAKAEAHAVREG